MKIYAKEIEQHIETNYWESCIALFGNAVSITQENRCILLLPPIILDGVINRITTSEEVIISKGPFPQKNQLDTLEFLFEDYSAAPIPIYCKNEYYDGDIPVAENSTKSLTCSVWTKFRKIKTLPAYYREVPRLPCLEPWD